MTYLEQRLTFSTIVLGILVSILMALVIVHKTEQAPMIKKYEWPNQTEREQIYDEAYNDGRDSMQQEAVKLGFAKFQQTGNETGPVFRWKTKEEVCGSKK